MITEFFVNVWTVLLDTAFWVLLGLLAAGVIKVFIPADAMRRWVGGRGLGAVSRAALFGAPLPLCSCGVLPAAIGLHRAGASKEATVSFLISTPETSVDSVVVTWALMGPVMAVYRPLAALCNAVVTGMLTSLVGEDARPAAREMPDRDATPCCGQQADAATGASCCADESAPSPGSSCCDGETAPATEASCCSRPEPAPKAACCGEARPQAAAPASCCGTEKAVSPSRTLRALQFAGAELVDDIALWLAVGIVVAGAMMTLIPPGWLAQWGGGLTAMLVMLVVGIPMYICAVASTPVAAGMLLAGVSPGAVLVFLLVGPATNVTSFALVRKELGGRVTLVYFAGLAVVSVVMGLLLEWLVARYDLVIEAGLGHAHAMLPEWLSIGSALLLILLALKPLRRRLLPVLG